ncbi:cyclin [Pyrrhoderma noxium]|uniref:Cyclin n=1 Tax=Pyrrhoderma noxium TaxID=2282107 RepID=A0A286UB71_9AGAM|nr:cyclin [Pyrrhoderma noxium]
MDPSQYVTPHSPSQIPASRVKYHHPYFSPAEVEHLSEKQRGKLSNQEKLKQQACSFIEAVGTKIGFPRRTIATAQNLYHRFHLFFPRKDFNYFFVTTACLYVSAKMHDTLKKPRDILMVSYTIRFHELVARFKTSGREVEIDLAIVEQDRQNLLGIERLVIETISFNFTVRMPFPYVIKFSRSLNISKKLARFAWRLASDSSRTFAPLQYPPHVVAMGCIYLAALLKSFERPPERPSTFRSSHELVSLLTQSREWESKYRVCIEDLEEICHLLLDLLIYAAQNTSTTTSPSTPSSPSPNTHPLQRNPRSSHPLHLTQQAASKPPPIPYKHDTLMRLKIHLRETEHMAKPRVDVDGANNLDELGGGKSGDAPGLGRNEGTVRFVFGPERLLS